MTGQLERECPFCFYSPCLPIFAVVLRYLLRTSHFSYQVPDSDANRCPKFRFFEDLREFYNLPATFLLKISTGSAMQIVPSFRKGLFESLSSLLDLTASKYLIWEPKFLRLNFSGEDFPPRIFRDWHFQASSAYVMRPLWSSNPIFRCSAMSYHHQVSRFSLLNFLVKMFPEIFTTENSERLGVQTKLRLCFRTFSEFELYLGVLWR